MQRSIPRIWMIALVVVLVVAAGGVFFALNRDKKEPPPDTAKTKSLPIGVINMEKAIASHPKYPAWTAMKQEEETLLGNFGKTEARLLNQEKNNILAMRESAGAVFEQEFNAKMKAKQDELNEKMQEKMRIISEPLNNEFKDYAQQLEAEYQPRLFDLSLKLRVLQVEEQQAKDIIAQMEALKAEQSAKIEAKNKELSEKLDELMAPEMKNLDEELNRYASTLNSELSAKMAAGMPPVAESGMPPELKELEEKIVAKKQETNTLYEIIVQDVRYKVIDIAVKNGLEAVIGNFTTNLGALDITDLVIEEFKK